jgi:branched-chain amino acid transport system substrate-binding protein
MKKHKSFIFFAVTILALMWAAPAAMADDIVFGYTGPLSGPGAEYGEDCANGLEMAIDEINQQGGVTVKGKKYTFRLEKMDDKVSPELAVANAGRLRKDHKAVAVFNPVATTIAPLMKINQEKKNEFIIMGYTSVPTMSMMGNKLLVTTATPFTMYIKVYVSLAWDKGWRKGAMVVAQGAYGEAWRKLFADAWTKKGGVITADKPANYYTRTDYAGPLAEALATDPDFILIGGPSATTALIIEQARARGFEGGFLMIDQAKLDAVRVVMEKPLGMEGCIGVGMVDSTGYPATETFTREYVARYKRAPTWESVLHYTHGHALAQAIEAAGSVDNPAAIRAAFPKIFPMLGDKYPMELWGITPTGLLIYYPLVQTMKHGRFTQATGYIWWLKTQREFEGLKRASKGSTYLVWFPQQ